MLRHMRHASQAVGVTLQSVEIRDPREIEIGFAVMIGQQANALLLPPDPLFLPHGKQIVDLAAKNRLVAMYGWRELAESGGLMAYGPSIPDMFRRAATYVDKILKGAKPGDLPIEQPTKFELVINLKTANALGITIPQSLLQPADEVIQ
jgi:putative ABC transport system substrate-binding protein